MTAQFRIAIGWLVAVSSVGHAQSPTDKAPKQGDPRWTSIARVFGQKGETHDGYFVIDPRCSGELFVLPNEIDAVGRALEERGLHVTAIHNHMVEETPRMYWMHWYGTGDGPTRARGVATALSHMNGARKSVSEE